MKEEVLAMLLSLEGVTQKKHFEREAFLVKRIFATLSETEKSINFKFSPEEQAVFIQHDSKAIFPVPNKWGLQGWTTCYYEEISFSLLMEMIRSAYKNAH